MLFIDMEGVNVMSFYFYIRLGVLVMDKWECNDKYIGLGVVLYVFRILIFVGYLIISWNKLDWMEFNGMEWK